MAFTLGREIGTREQKLEEMHTDIRHIRDSMATNDHILTIIDKLANLNSLNLSLGETRSQVSGISISLNETKQDLLETLARMENSLGLKMGEAKSQISGITETNETILKSLMAMIENLEQAKTPAAVHEAAQELSHKVVTASISLTKNSLQKLIDEHPDFTVSELQKKAEEEGICSRASFYRYWRKMKTTSAGEIKETSAVA